VILAKAIDEGYAYGRYRAHKHTDTPDPLHLENEIINAIWNAIDEVIEFEQEEPYVLQ
jgi:hypothetical protein